MQYPLEIRVAEGQKNNQCATRAEGRPNIGLDTLIQERFAFYFRKRGGADPSFSSPPAGEIKKNT